MKRFFTLSARRITPAFVAFLFAFLAIIYVNLLNVGSPILEEHGFRQTQTAIASYYFVKEGFTIRYLTPVLGEPWSTPFEFPIYQYVVAAIVKVMGLTDLAGPWFTGTGRLVSLTFALLTCIPVFHALKRLKMETEACYFALAMYLSAPIYMFWSGTFMMECTAVFFMCCFLYYAIKVMQRGYTNRDLILLSLFLTLAMLQKITTVLPSLAVMGLLIGWGLLRNGDLHPKNLRTNLPMLLKLAISVLVPVAIAFAWVKYSDMVKLENPIASGLTSANLTAFNYGSLAQRVSAQLWLGVVFMRNVRADSFSILGPLLILATLALGRKSAVSGVVLVCVALFLIPFLVFTNLHMVHNYYQSANAIFWSVAAGLSVFYIIRRFLKSRTQQTVVLGLFMLSNYYYFGQDYYHDKTTPITSANRTMQLAEFIKAETPPDLPVIFGGFDSSSEPSFYTERKSITLPFWKDVTVEALTNTSKFLSQSPSAIVDCAGPQTQVMESLIMEKYPTIAPFRIADCNVYILHPVPHLLRHDYEGEIKWLNR